MRIRHVDSVDELIHADAQTVADEYGSVVRAEEHEFRDDAERDRYAALVHAWGQFAHGQAFAAVLAAGTPSKPTATARVEPLCRDCGGDSLVRDASARWDEAAQDWTISGVYDATYCDDCESESDTLCRWVPVGERDAGAA